MLSWGLRVPPLPSVLSYEYAKELQRMEVALMNSDITTLWEQFGWNWEDKAFQGPRACKGADPAPSLTSLSCFQVSGMGSRLAQTTVLANLTWGEEGSDPSRTLELVRALWQRFPALGADGQTLSEKGFIGTGMKKAELGLRTLRIWVLHCSLAQLREFKRKKDFPCAETAEKGNYMERENSSSSFAQQDEAGEADKQHQGKRDLA